MASSLVFNVRMQEPVLVAPARPTPHEFMDLSDIDDQDGLRFQLPLIQLYRKCKLLEGLDLARVMRDAVAKALVFYYPLAGRLREGPGRKLVVECTGEGIIFVEGDADVKLEQFGEAPLPPFPCFDQLLCDVPGTGDILNSPLLLIQLTRLSCGGFALALRVNHTICDGAGVVQFMIAVAEMALGARAPSIPPVWQRNLLKAQGSPLPTYPHPEYDEVDPDATTFFYHPTTTHRSFFFGPTQLSALRKHLPPSYTCTTFELLTACLWRCRTIAIAPKPHDQVRVICIVDARAAAQIPLSYYGNVLAFPVATSPAEELWQKPLEYAVELVKGAKAHVTKEYMQSVADLMVLKGRPHFGVTRTWAVSDLTRRRSREVEFGFGKPIYSGPPIASGAIPGVISFYVPFENEKGEDGLVVPMSLPGPIMEKFSFELHNMINPVATRFFLKSYKGKFDILPHNMINDTTTSYS